MFKLNLSKLTGFLKRLKNRGKIKRIQRNALLNMLDRLSAKTKKYHRFENRTFLLQNSVEYGIQGDKGFLFSENVNYNDYIYSGSDRYNTTWAPDPWILNTYEAEKDVELKIMEQEIARELDGYLT